VPLTPNFSFYVQKVYIIWWRLKKRIDWTHPILAKLRLFEVVVFWFTAAQQEIWGLGANALVTSAGEAGFLPLEAIVWLAGFHLKFLAFKSYEVWPQPSKSLKSPRNGIRQYRFGLFDWVRGLWLSVLSRRIASKTLKWRQVKVRNRKSVRMSV